MARDHATANKASASSAWQPVQPTSREERIRYRQRQFTPIIGSVVDAGDDFRTSARPGSPAASTPAPSPQTGKSRPWAPSSATTQAEAARSHAASSKKARAQELRRKAIRRAQLKGGDAREGTTSPSAGTGHVVAAVIMGVLAIIVASSSWLVGFVFAIIALVQAGKAKKLGSSAVLGRSLGILGIIVASLALITTAFNSMGGLLDNDSYAPDGDTSSGVVRMLSTTPSEARVEELARAQFDKLVNPDEDTIQRVADVLDESMYEWYGFTHADLGLDATETARWALEGGSYSLSSVFAFDDDKEGSAYADVTVRDTSALDNTLWEAVSSVESDTLEELRNNPADLEIVASAYRDALESTPEMDDRFIDLQFTLEDGEWVLDEEYWDYTLDDLYHM